VQTSAMLAPAPKGHQVAGKRSSHSKGLPMHQLSRLRASWFVSGPTSKCLMVPHHPLPTTNVLRRMPSSVMLRRVALVRTDVSEELSASIIRVTRISELGTLAITSNRRTLRRNTK
jgi:hypothetical protein